ncbi:MAG: TIM barrel protein [Opitutaceae bacterium]|nr:TIM barrel protein [Opitutaceae bacterium]
MQLGISSFAFGWAVGTPAPLAPVAFTTETLLDFAVAHRVSVIQFGDNLPLHALTEEALDRFAARACSHRVAIETGARGLTAAQLERYIGIARRLDARLLRFVIDAKGYEPDLAAIAAIIRDELPALRSANVVLGIENHDRFPCATLRRLVDTIASEHVGICLDTANSLGAGEGIGEVLAALAPVCVNLHVKDYAIERLPSLMGFTVTGRSLGCGMLPIDRVLDSVAQHGRCTTAVVETWPPPEPELAATLAKELRWAGESVATLRAALARRAKPI